MSHEDVQTLFVIVAALALVIQAAMLFAMFRLMKFMLSKIEQIESGVREHLNPVLDSVRAVTASTREPINTILANLIEVTGIVKQRAASADAVAAEVMERARLEIIRVDELITGIVGRVERAADAAERGVLAPLREVSAIIAGIRSGIGFFFARQRPGAKRGPTAEEQLFI
jgi:hypothetical protein